MSQEFLSERLLGLAESQTLAMSQRARDLQSEGHSIIRLNLGEPDFATPQFIKDAAKKAMDDNQTFYPPVQGVPQLIQGIIKKLKRDNGLDYEPSNILVSNGAKQSITNVFLTLVNKGDEVIVFSPFWVSYSEQIKLAEGTPVYIKGSLENDFKVTADQLRAAITDKTKAIIFSSPCNPTGSVFTKEELRAIADVVKENPNVFIISDEIYEYILFDDEKHVSIASFDDVKDQVIIVNGFSKGYAMTGWRIGYIAAPTAIAQGAKKIQGQVTSGACSIAQMASVAAIEADITEPLKMRDEYAKRRDLVKSLLDEIPGVITNTPKGAFYIFPDVSNYFGTSFRRYIIKDGFDLSMYLLQEAHVAVVDGVGFGEPKCLRISYAASEKELREAIQRIKAALSKLL